MDTPAPDEPGDASIAAQGSPDASGRDLPVAPVPEIGEPAHETPRSHSDASSDAAPSTPAPELRVEARETPGFRFSAADESRLIAGVTPRRISPPRSSRFILLAACVGLSACLGAAAGTASLLALEHPTAPPPLPAQPTQPARVEPTDEVRALKETVGQLRNHLKSLDANVGTLRTALNGTSSATAGQLAKITDLVEKIRAQAERVAPERTRTERVQAERQAERVPNESGQAERAQTERNPAERNFAERNPVERHAPPGSASATTPTAPGSASEATGATVTGTVGQVAEAKTGPVVIESWVLRQAREGAALIEGRYGTIEIEPGDYLPGIGRVEEIKRQGGRWVVVTPKGLIMSR